MAVQEIQGSGFFTLFAIQAIRNPTDIWIALGQSNDWGGTTPPPNNETGLPNPIIYKRIDAAFLVKSVEETDPHEFVYRYLGSTYYFKTITEEEACTLASRWILYTCTISPQDGDLGEYEFRAWSIYHNLIPKTGHLSDNWLLPANVENTGNCIFIAHSDTPSTINERFQAVVTHVIPVGGY